MKRLMYLESLLAHYHYAETRWSAETLLTGCEHDIDAPCIHLNLLAGNGTDSIDHDLEVTDEQ